MKGGGHDIKICLLSIEHAKTIMVLRSNNDVFHPRILRKSDPFFSVEFFGVELLNKFLILSDWNLSGSPDPFSMRRIALPLTCGHRVQSPMNEQSKPCILPP